jgi:hypothetical protein
MAMRNSIFRAVGLSTLLLPALGGCSAAAGDKASSSAASAICTVPNVPAPCPRGQSCVGPANDSRRFAETGITVRGAFLDFMNQTGGVEGTGLPLSNVWKSVSRDGRAHYTQCFERQVLEFHEENAGDCRYTVLGRQLAKDRYERKYGSAGAPNQMERFAGRIPDSREMHCFDQVPYCIESEMYAWWQRTGGLEVNGYPISNYFAEESPEEPGRAYTVQYFERTVGEYHYVDGNYVPVGQLLGKYAPECPNIGPPIGVKTRLVSARSAATIRAAWWTTSSIGDKQTVAAWGVDGSLVVRLTEAVDADGRHGMEVYPPENAAGARYKAADVAKLLAAYSNDNEEIDTWKCLGAVAHLFLSGVATVLECKEAVETGDATFCTNELITLPTDVADVADACWSDKDPVARGTRQSCELLNNGVFKTVGENCNGELDCRCYIVE